jgi:2-methylisocitrate lyase-like PEP mutase family enzyme
MSQTEKVARFRALHERAGAFVIPNPWDAGSARLLEGLGFEALATTSSGFAQTLGRLDGQVSLEEKAEHCRAVCAATQIPVSADLENGFGHDPAEVALTITSISEAGVAGGSIEDYANTSSAIAGVDPTSGIYDIGLARERIQAAAEAAQGLSVDFVLTARAENLLRGVQDLDDTLARLNAYAEAGADVLYAPGLNSLKDLRTLARAVDKPINVLAPFFAGASVEELAEAGAKRISIGGALANVAIGAILEAGNEMQERGTFGWLAKMAPRGEITRLLGES